jgi:hypothetical protein
MSAANGSKHRTTRILIWLLFVTAIGLLIIIGFSIAGQGMSHLDNELTRTLGRSQLLTAGGILVLGPMICWVLRDVFLIILGYHEQFLSLRRAMHTLANRAQTNVGTIPVRPVAPWSCPDCQAENNMASKACAQCGAPYRA